MFFYKVYILLLYPSESSGNNQSLYSSLLIHSRLNLAAMFELIQVSSIVETPKATLNYATTFYRTTHKA